jgi:hypothetical protein
MTVVVDVFEVRESSACRVWYLVMVQRVEEKRGKVRKRTDVPLHFSRIQRRSICVNAGCSEICLLRIALAEPQNK